MKHAMRFLAPLWISGCCLFLLFACAPDQAPRQGSMEDLPSHPEAQIVETVPVEVMSVVSQTERWVGAMCPGLWRNYIVTGTVEEVHRWYRSAMMQKGWADAADEVVPFPGGGSTSSVLPAPIADDEEVPPTWSVWYRDQDDERSMAVLYLNPAGLSVALASATQTEERAPASPVVYTYVMVFYCPIRE